MLSTAAPAIQDGSGAGVGYTFADDVTAEKKSDICQLLARWGRRSEDERRRAESLASVKAPGGEVVYFSGVVPFVHNSKTEHLWVSANVPPPAAAPPPRQGALTVGAGRHEPGQNPWRGRPVDAGTFQPIGSDRQDPSSNINESGGMRGGAEIGGAAKYVVDDPPPRRRRGNSLASEEKEGKLIERESRHFSEPGSASARTNTVRNRTMGGKGRSRRRGSTSPCGRGQSDQSEASAGQGDEPAARPRIQSEATERSTTIRPRANAPVACDLPRNQHRKLRPLARQAQNKQETTKEPGEADAAPASILTPSAPSKIRPSKSTKTSSGNSWRHERVMP